MSEILNKNEKNLLKSVPVTICNQCYKINFNHPIIQTGCNSCPVYCPLINCRKCTLEYCAIKGENEYIEPLCKILDIVEESEDGTFLIKIDNNKNLNVLSTSLAYLCNRYSYDFFQLKEEIKSFLIENKKSLVELFINDFMRKDEKDIYFNSKRKTNEEIIKEIKKEVEEEVKKNVYNFSDESKKEEYIEELLKRSNNYYAIEINLNKKEGEK